MSAKAVVESTGTGVLYAYRNVLTNQVLYSLKEALIPSALKQLPFIGANRTPATVRRDVWRPFFTVHFGTHNSAATQARHAYKKLLEWRRLHEVAWVPPPELAISYTEEQVQTIKEDMKDHRGGSKIDRAYDLIKKHKKNLKARMIMDQKANSVADLAAVLFDQQRLSVHQARQQRTYRRLQSIEIQRLVDLAKSPEYIRSLEQEMEALKTTMAGQSWKDTPEIVRLKKEIHELDARRLVVERRGQGQAPLEKLAQAQARLLELKPQTKAGLKRELEELQKQRKLLESAIPVLESYNSSRMLHKEIYNRLRSKTRTDLEAREEDLRSAEEKLKAVSEDQETASARLRAANEEDRATLDQELKVATKAQRAAQMAVMAITEQINALKDEDNAAVVRCRLDELKAFLRGQQYTGFPKDLRPWDALKGLTGPLRLPSAFEPAVNVEWDHKPDRSFAQEWPQSVSHVTQTQGLTKTAEHRREFMRRELVKWEEKVIQECKDRQTEAPHSSSVGA